MLSITVVMLTVFILPVFVLTSSMVLTTLSMLVFISVIEFFTLATLMACDFVSILNSSAACFVYFITSSTELLIIFVFDLLNRSLIASSPDFGGLSPKTDLYSGDLGSSTDPKPGIIKPFAATGGEILGNPAVLKMLGIKFFKLATIAVAIVVPAVASKDNNLLESSFFLMFI